VLCARPPISSLGCNLCIRCKHFVSPLSHDHWWYVTRVFLVNLIMMGPYHHCTREIYATQNQFLGNNTHTIQNVIAWISHVIRKIKCSSLFLSSSLCQSLMLMLNSVLFHNLCNVLIIRHGPSNLYNDLTLLFRTPYVAPQQHS